MRSFKISKKSIRQNLFLWFKQHRFGYSFQRDGWRFEIVVPKRLKGVFKWAKNSLTVIGLFSAFIIFQSALIAFLFSLGLFILATLLEKTIFSFTTLYITPLPDFKIEPAQWLSTYFGYAVFPNRSEQAPIVGWIIQDEDYARRLHELLLLWTYGELTDKDKNISMSVTVCDDYYIFLCYPSLERETIRQVNADANAECKKHSPNDRHEMIITLQPLGKRFAFGKNSYFKKFRKRYSDGVPFIFRLSTLGSNGQPQEISGLDDLFLFDLKIRNRYELTKMDMEYDLVRFNED